MQQAKVPQRAVEKQYYKMPELVGFQTMEILDPNGVTFDTVGVFGWEFKFYLNLAHHIVSQTKGGEQGGHFDRAVKKNTSQPLRSLTGR